MKPKKKSGPVLRALQKMLGPTFEDIGSSDIGQGLAAYGQQFMRDPGGTVASLFDPVGGVKQSARSLNEFRTHPGFGTAMTALADGIGGTPGLGAVARPTVLEPQRVMKPGIYERPDVIARKAAANTEPESPMLKRLFKVTRDDLYEMGKRKGNMPGEIPGAAKKPEGSEAAGKIMVRKNEQRLIDILAELQDKAPDMFKGMVGWYPQDPMLERMVKLSGREKGTADFKRLNTFGGIESPEAPVSTEFHRATVANWLHENGRWHDWEKYGGMGADAKELDIVPADMRGTAGRKGHVDKVKSMRRYLDTGKHGMKSPKAPLYIDASGTPQTGFQTDIPVGDAHWSRGVGLSDVRTNKGFGHSVATPELQQLAPWWRERIAAALGMESVPAQAVLWGGLGHATGVKTRVGAPKLELQAIEMARTAKRLGISPEKARDLILTGKTYAGGNK